VTEQALIDTGPMVALYHDKDPHHARCRAALAQLAPPLLTGWPVITEAAWLLRKRPDALKAVFAGFGSGLFALLPLDSGDLAGIAAILARYETTGIQLADASLAHLADREGIRTVFTIDRRDFSVIRLKRNRTLRLIPDPR
jgi:predicted nucleic acid-binding protein